MKRKTTLLGSVIALAMLLSISFISVNAQEEAEAESPISVGADVVSRYVWRGGLYSVSPAIQPGIEFAKGGLAIGAWGSYTTGGAEFIQEADLYVSYTVAEMVTVAVTDYYFPDELNFPSYFDSLHILELSVGAAISDLSLLAAVNLAGDDDNSMYFEAGYSFGIFDLVVGAGNGAYTGDGDFNLVNVGLTASKEITVTDKFSLPVFGQFIVNPDSKQPYIVFGFSL